MCLGSPVDNAEKPIRREYRHGTRHVRKKTER